MNTDERLKQIRERKDALGLRHGDWPCQTVHNSRERAFQQYILADIDFLLSLLDSQADPRPNGNQHYLYCARHKGGEYDATLACTCYDYPLVAATRMRDKCVEKVRELQRDWDKAQSYEFRDATFYVVAALESLTLDSLAEKGEDDDT